MVLLFTCYVVGLPAMTLLLSSLRPVKLHNSSDLRWALWTSGYPEKMCRSVLISLNNTIQFQIALLKSVADRLVKPILASGGFLLLWFMECICTPLNRKKFVSFEVETSSSWQISTHFITTTHSWRSFGMLSMKNDGKKAFSTLKPR